MHRSLRTLSSSSFSFWEFRATQSGRSEGSWRRLQWTSFGTLNVGNGGNSLLGSIQDQIVDVLRLGERSRASSMLFDLSQSHHSLRADDFVQILEYCARAPDPLFVMETWRIIKGKELAVSNKCRFLIIRALCKGGYLDEAFNLVGAFGENEEFSSVLPMYNSLLGACAECHSVTHANKCLDLMEHRVVGKNEITYTELLKLAVSRQNLLAVHDIWKECTKYYSHNIISLRKFIWSFTRLNDLNAALKVLKQMVALVDRGESIITRTAEGKLFNSRLDIPIPSNNDLDLSGSSMESEASIPSTYQNCRNLNTRAMHMGNSRINSGEMESVRSVRTLLGKNPSSPVMKVLRWSFGDMLHACAQTQNYELAEQLFAQMQNLGVEPSSSTYDCFIRALVHERGFHDGIEVLKLMQQKNLKPHDSTLATISVSCSKGLEVDLAEAFLNQISKSSCAYPYNALLEACDTLDQPERAVRILGKMKQSKLQPDIRTYELLFSLFGNVNAPYEAGDMLSQKDVAKRISAIEKDMMRNGIQHSYLSVKNLLRALGTEGMIRELIYYLHAAEKLFSHSNSFVGTALYNTVLHSLVEAKESSMAIDIFKNLLSCGYRPDAVTYNVMIDCCSILRCFKSACALVSMMIRDGFYPQVLTYTALIKILLEFETFDEALSLLDQGLSDQIQPDALLFNTLLQAACEKERIDIIELLVERMHQEKVQPDSSTCSFVFSAYVNAGFLSTAMEALQVLSVRIICEEINLDVERTALEDDFIYAEDPEAESRVLKLFKNSRENLAVALLNLRWCAIQGNLISWFPNENQWAKRLSSTYGHG